MASPKTALSALLLVFICVPSRGKIEWREPIALSPARAHHHQPGSFEMGIADAHAGRHGKGDSDV